jgi:anthranilate synthase/aminodeoxychorismate synthase-like glutamine amidotransferase
MISTAPPMSSASISAGTQRGLSRIEAGIGGVYRADVCTPSVLSEGFVRVRSPGRVPLGVVLPPVLRFGGATSEQSRAPATRSTEERRSGQAVAVTRVLVIDSYDSFVYNLVQYLGELGADPIVHRNDAIDVSAALAVEPDAVLLSPGPGRPEDAGILCDVIPEFAARRVPVLGVCLGHQAIGQVYGGEVVRAPELMHGKTSPVEHRGVGVFAGLPSPLTATRYHSLVVDPASVPECLEVTASTPDGMVMGLRHRELEVEGVQFHPESILTAVGHDVLRNFLARAD